MSVIAYSRQWYSKWFTNLSALCRVAKIKTGDNMKKLIAAVFVVGALQCHWAYAIQMASPKSNKMVKVCTLQEGEVADAACQAFVQGVADATAFYGAAEQMTLPFCIPGETTPAELVVVYRDYLESNHALRQFSAAALAISALRETFPCE